MQFQENHPPPPPHPTIEYGVIISIEIVKIRGAHAAVLTFSFSLEYNEKTRLPIELLFLMEKFIDYRDRIIYDDRARVRVRVCRYF